ncbi:MAG TPA: TMEM175 family protein [Candidatus Angelobacter sp.]
MSTKPTSVRSLLHSIALSKGRMEALTDGIFAIAMTLLVLELKIPDLPKSASTSELLQNIGHEGPAFSASWFHSFIAGCSGCCTTWPCILCGICRLPWFG